MWFHSKYASQNLRYLRIPFKCSSANFVLQWAAICVSWTGPDHFTTQFVMTRSALPTSWRLNLHLPVDELPIPLMRCLDMHMSAVNNPKSIGHILQKKKLVFGLGNLVTLWSSYWKCWSLLLRWTFFILLTIGHLAFFLNVTLTIKKIYIHNVFVYVSLWFVGAEMSGHKRNHK